MTSQAKVRANKLNAQKSTGPRTKVGKDRSRGNALRHGLSGGYVVVARALGGILKAAVNELRKDTPPRNMREEEMLERIAIDCFRIEYCQASALTLMVRSWDDDCRQSAIRLARQISSDALVGSLVDASMPRRAADLVERCTRLVRRSDEGKNWSADDHSLAFDLVGAMRAEQVSVPAIVTESGARPEDEVEHWGRYFEALERFLRGREVRDRWTMLLELPRDFLPDARSIERYEVGAESRIRQTLSEWHSGRWRLDAVQEGRTSKRRVRRQQAIPTAS